jgi:triphosphoribosyl-dephospho-CoA synthase
VNPAADAELALLLEVAGTPKPGNVDRVRDHDDLRFEQFLGGAVGARPGLRRAAEGERVGAAFESAVEGMADAAGSNTHFGALLMLCPLVRAAGDGDLSAERASAVVESTTVADAADFYRAFEHTDVALGDPPEGASDIDARRGADAIPALRERGLALSDVMELGADSDGVAAEWVAGFPRTFDAADYIAGRTGTLADRGAEAFLRLLAEEPDTLVATNHGREVAREVRGRAGELLDAPEAEVEAFADELVERGVNPGTTADIAAAALFVSLRRGESLG